MELLPFVELGMDTLTQGLIFQRAQQFPPRLRKSYVTMGANSSLSVSPIRLCLLMCVS
jgi:hypothetical protein